MNCPCCHSEVKHDYNPNRKTMKIDCPRCGKYDAPRTVFETKGTKENG